MFASLLHAFRSWKSARTVGALATAALAIGIGSATAIFSVVYAVLLKPLPYDHPERFFQVFGHLSPQSQTNYSYPDYLDYASQLRTVEAFGCSTSGDFNLVFKHKPVHVTGTEVSAGLMRSLAVSPLMGRWFEDNDGGSSEAPRAVISASLWRRLGSDPNILGRPITLNGIRYTISGVMPAWFRYPVYWTQNEIWMPLDPTPNQRKSRAFHYLVCVAKTKADVTPQVLETDFDRISSELRRKYPGAIEPEFTRANPVLTFVNQNIRPNLILLLVAAGALFLITCANVASMLLARSAARTRETAVRIALGATNRQLALQYFWEGLLVSLAGAALGTVLSFALVRVVLSIAADYIPRADQISFNWPVVGFAVTLAIGCGVFFSISPLWQARRTAPNEFLAEGARASSSARSRRLLRAFVIAEVALAFGLLAVGGLIVGQLTGLYGVRPGFDPSNLLVMTVDAPLTKYKDSAARLDYETRLGEAIRAIPGVENAGFISWMPLSWGNNTAVFVEGRPRPEDLGHTEWIEERFISLEYFQTMKIPLAAGRFFTPDDKEGDLMPMLINQTLANLYWPHNNPVGAYVRIFGLESKRFQVVGVAGDVRNAGLARPPRPEFYLSFRENTPTEMNWTVRSRVDRGALAQQLRRAVESIDPELTIFNVRTMNEVIVNSLSRQRLQSLMVTFFAGSALLLSMLGVYSVISYTARQRTTELGTRMAVGAAPRDLLKLVLGDGFKAVFIGVGIGAILVLTFAYILASSDLEVRVSGPLPFFVATFLIVGCTFVACWFPAWRATTLSPMVAIHSDVHASSSRLSLSYRVLLERASENHAPGAQIPGTELLAAIADSSRRANSFSEAIGAALGCIEEQVNASSVFLFSRAGPDGPFRMTSSGAKNEQFAECSLPPDSLLLNRLRNYGSALPISRGDLVVLRRWASEHAPQRLVEIEMLERIGVALAAPLMSKSEVTGMLFLGPHAGRGDYDAVERRALRSATEQLALLLENHRLTDRIVEQERLRRELLLAAEVQKRLFPEGAPETTSIQLTGMCLPARGVGGDYYDFLDLGNRQIGIALADVAGKGLAAALIMSVVQASLRSLAGTNGASLAELASKMNRLLHRSTASNSYATFFYAQFDEELRRMRYVNAGHNPPLLLRACGTHSRVPFVASVAPIEELCAGGTIIGMFSQCNYEEAMLELASGDVLMAFSDGVTEAHNPSDEEFGDERLKDLLRRTAHLPINDMAAHILQELKAWMADAPQYDDLTFVLMKVV